MAVIDAESKSDFKKLVSRTKIKKETGIQVTPETSVCYTYIRRQTQSYIIPGDCLSSLVDK